jgi:hypothetical protein
MKHNLNCIKTHFLTLIQQPSTWRGLAWIIAGILAITHLSDLRRSFEYFIDGSLIAGGIGTLFKDTTNIEKATEAIQEGLNSANDVIETKI